ncbi:TPA: nucleoside phosphorylase [Candidatus Woesearchaeota archaeon]|nr:nucleoside phosphorylase [Candidatus Woesearchaeota archaeon]HIH54637.1 nucleoside phosphorylase [Candidatus Woesearchaeota archaeon]HIJ14213.1 nucleoside phosphorylase [Candidatus Woesearchaeota archaeon]
MNYTEKCWIEPSTELKYDIQYDFSKLRVYPKVCIMCYQDEFIELAKNKFNAKKIETLLGYGYYIFECDNIKIGIIKIGIGAPMMALILERLIARRINTILNIGIAGSLQYKNIPIGGIVLCTKALRYEGTSKFYVPPSKFVYPNKELNQRIEKNLKNMHIPYIKGPTVTTDAPYRLSVSKCRELRKQGIITSDMESAAVFAISQHRKIKSAAIFVISDVATKDFSWNPGFHDNSLKKGIELLFEVSVNSLK